MCSAFVTGKGSKQRTVYFNARTKLLMTECLRSRHAATDNDALFVSMLSPYAPMNARGIQKIITDIGTRAGVTPLHPHLFRHTFASNAVNAGMDVLVIQKLLGHEDVGTTQIYAELNQENVKQAYFKLNI
jgi:integrase/recombinase XerD